MKAVLSSLAAVAIMAIAVGCQSSHASGVKSSYRSQWTPVAADTKKTTDAAKSVLGDEGLKEINAESTNVDGKAWGKKADGTVVNVTVKKDTDAVSNVSVTVGTLGDPALGAEIAKKIKLKAEGL